jgi:tRNA(Met) cytidine acetyltransferase
LPLATAVYQGERRVQGHLLAQSLAFHLAQPALATLSLARVQRIVIHPVWQNSGLGRFLLRALETHAKSLGCAAIGSSFGATPALVRFWTEQGFQPIKLSAQAEQASGEPSMLVLKACEDHYEQTVSWLQQQFAADLYWHLADSQRQLDPELALQLCQPPLLMHCASKNNSHSNDNAGLNHDPLPELRLFAEGKRPFELVELHLLDWLNRSHHRLPAEIAALLVQKLWQKQSWASLSKQHSGAGKLQLLAQIRQAIALVCLESR